MISHESKLRRYGVGVKLTLSFFQGSKIPSKSTLQYMRMNDSSATNSGASNASDFQPPTQNPQSASPDLQPTPSEGTTDRLDQLPAQPLTVETVQSSPDALVSQVSSPNDTGGSFTGLLPFLVVLVLAIWLFRRWNLFSPSTPLVQPVTVERTETKKPIKKTTTKPTNSRPKKKSKNKK